jgi:hypothetical protein
MRQHEGNIAVKSVLGEGTEFLLRFWGVIKLLESKDFFSFGTSNWCTCKTLKRK